MLSGLSLALVPSRRPAFAGVADFPGFCIAGMALAVLLLAPACQKTDAESAVRGLEQALHDTRASLAALGMPQAPEAAETVSVAGMPAPPTTSTPRHKGAGAPATAIMLQGQTADQVISALDEPALRRREGSAEIWLYQASDCRLDLVFYREAAGLVLSYAAARALGARRLTEAACLSAIANAPHPPPWTLAGRAGEG